VVEPVGHALVDGTVHLDVHEVTHLHSTTPCQSPIQIWSWITRNPRLRCPARLHSPCTW
jgi:hypothetical protein